MLKLIGESKDLRTNTTIIYGQTDIANYLKLIGPDFADFNIQRRRENHKAYQRLKDDIVKGAQIPSITLAIRPEFVKNYIQSLNPVDLKKLEQDLNYNPKLHILDGLQRTYILKDLEESGHVFDTNQKVLLEFWFESNIKVLIYRIIVLNAGQKPMSMRHQVELLFETIAENLKKEIPSLVILKERDGETRTNPKEFQFVKLVSAYQCFLTKSHEITKENIVTQQLIEQDLYSVTEEQALDNFTKFEALLKLYIDIDEEICRVYPATTDRAEGSPTGLAWWGNENVINALFSSISSFSSDAPRTERATNSINKLLNDLKGAKVGDDPLGLIQLHTVQQGINPRKVNVGFATRKLLASVFKEFIRDGGNTPMSTLWAIESE